MTTIMEFAAAALETPDSFINHSDDAYNTHGCVAGITRDSDLLDQSNWSVWLQELGLTSKVTGTPTGNPCGLGTHVTSYDDTDDVFVQTSSHWACGWVDTLMVRVYLNPDQPDDGILDESQVYTPAFLRAYELRQQLANYPVLDEEDYSERETQDLHDTLVSCYHVPEELGWEAVSFVWDNAEVTRGDDIGRYAEGVIAEFLVSKGIELPSWMTPTQETA